MASGDVKVLRENALGTYDEIKLSDVYMASDVLDKIKTVDGTGSGLDADLLDGNHASAFALTDQTMYIGTTAVAINRISNILTLSGVSLNTLTAGSGLSGTAYNGGANQTWSINFGTGAGTVLEGRTFGTAANSAVEDFALAGHTHSYDNYGSWTLQGESANGSAITSGTVVNIKGTGATTVSKGVGTGIITINSTDTNTWVANTLNVAGYVSAPSAGNANQVWKCDVNGNPAWRADSDTTYSVFTRVANGLVPFNAGSGTVKYLREDGTWQIPIAEDTSILVTQNAHGFSVGNAIKLSGSTWVKSRANTAANAGTLGLVSQVVDVNNFRYIIGGVLSGTYTSGASYFLSVTTAGNLFIQSDPEVWNIGDIREFIGTGLGNGLLVELDIGTEIQEEVVPVSIWDLTGISNTGWAEGKVLKFDASGNLIVGTDLEGEGGSGITLSSLSATSPIAYNSTSGVFSVAAGYTIPTSTEKGHYDTAYGWGNHSGLYESPLTFVSGVKRTINAISMDIFGLDTIVNPVLADFIPMYKSGTANKITFTTLKSILEIPTNTNELTNGANYITAWNIQVNGGTTASIGSNTTLNFTAGTNMTITRSGNDITFASAGEGGGASGTVTSVALTVPTGLVINSGSPITTAGTIAIGLQSGYSIPTTANQTNWNTTYTDIGKVRTTTVATRAYLYGSHFTYDAGTTSIQIQQTGTVTSGSSLLVTSGGVYTAVNAKENSLGNPGTNGYVLSSTTAGVRSWISISPTEGAGIDITSNVVSLDINSLVSNLTPSATDYVAYHSVAGGVTRKAPFSYMASLAIYNASSLQNYYIAETVPTTNQVLKFNGTSWAPSTITVSSAWGSITGTLSSQTDLQTALDAKAALAGLSTQDFNVSRLRLGGATAWHLYPNGTTLEFNYNSTIYATLNTSGIFIATNFQLSDEKLKENIESIRNVPDLSNVNFVQFSMKSDITHKKHYGVIAQELEKIAPELVYTDEKDIKSVNYVELLVLKVSQLEKRIKQLENGSTKY